MCLIILAYGVHPRFPLILAANRDEFHKRPTLPAHFWTDRPDILAGKDLQGGGTWLGISRQGLFAALTNHRDLRRSRPKGSSRGQLVLNALDPDRRLTDTSGFEGFNLIHGPIDALKYHSNVSGADEMISVGFHGLSNHFLDTPWPKVVSARQRIQRIIENGDPGPDALFEVLMDRVVPKDDELPDTGVGLAWERVLAPVFISGDEYGTRCSTVVLVDRTGLVHFEERTHIPGPPMIERFTFQL
jgi:uncharacterized protein with NRDE domain